MGLNEKFEKNDIEKKDVDKGLGKEDIIERIYKNNCNEKIEQCCILEELDFPCFKETFNGIVLTPYCDIVNNNCDFLTVAQIVPLDSFFLKFLATHKHKLSNKEMTGQVVLNKGKYKDIYESFKDILKNKKLRYYFLPENDKISPHSIIDFNMIQSILLDDFVKYKKLCTVKSPWSEDIISSYASYCVRIGTEDYPDEFLKKVFNSVSNLKKKN